jgi:hypothetical protein
MISICTVEKPQNWVLGAVAVELLGFLVPGFVRKNDADFVVVSQKLTFKIHSDQCHRVSPFFDWNIVGLTTKLLPEQP